MKETLFMQRGASRGRCRRRRFPLPAVAAEEEEEVEEAAAPPPQPPPPAAS